MPNKKTALFCAILLGLTGCMNLAPTYEKPEVELAERWIAASLKDNRQTGDSVANLGWRDYFRDPQLQGLIETALANNHDLRQAALNIEIAKQQHNIQQADKAPMLGTNAGYTRSQAKGRTGDRYQVGLGVSNFELDFFGRIKNQSEAALNRYLQTQEARDAAQLSIINAVAKTYFQWRISAALRDLAEHTAQSREKSLKLVKLRFREGLAAGTDVTTAQSLLASAKASYQQQVRNTQQAENALATLVGKPIERLSLPESQPLAKQFQAQELFIDTPSQVLFKRPDIRQAEYGLKAANANIGAARALMYPSITLTGNLGYVSAELNTLLKDRSQQWSFGPSVALPIFDAGKRKANIKITELQQQMAVENYQKTVKTAFQEVADALIAKETLNKQYAAQQQGRKAASETLRMVKLQAQEGLASGLNLLDAERADFGAQQAVLATQLQTLTNRVDLYTAMGGGLLEQSDANP